MADQRITQLTSLPKAGVAATDVLPIADISASQTKKVTAKDLVDAGLDLIDASSIDIDKLDQASVTKLSTTALADDAVTAAKLANDSSIAVQTTEPSTDNFEGRGYFNSTSGNLQVFNGSAYQQVVVPTAGIGDLQVITDKLADGAVTTAKVTALDTAAYADSSVTTDKIADGAVTATKIAADSITATQVAPNAIGASELADSAVDTAAIVNLAVIEAKLAGGAVTTNKLGDLAVTDSKIAATTITYGKLNLADGAVPASKLTDATVTGAKLAANAVGTAAVADDAITTDKVADDAITTDKVADGAITTAKVDVAGLSADAIAADAITTDKVLDGAITGAKMADDSATIVQAGVPTGSGDFEGQQYFDTNTSVQYVWDSTAWIRQAAINTINFTDNTPIVFAIAYPDNHTANVTTSLDTQVANTAFLGPAAGADVAPTFRAIVPADLPDATASTKGIVQPGTGLSVNGGTLNHTNSVATGTYTKLTVDAEGHISAGALLEAVDIPDIDAAKIITGELPTDRLADGAVTIDKLADYSTASLGETFPIPSFIGQIHLNPLDKSFYMWDGNVWVPIGISAGQIIFAGTFDASDPVGTGKIASVTPEGAAAGFTVNSAVPASAPSNNKHYFVVSEGGTITSGNAPNVTLAPPDLILSVYNTSSPGWVEVDVSASAGTVAATQVSFAPAGDISAAATTVQLAIEEVSTECRNASNITSGTLAVARGGTNLASYTKGDVIAASGATTLVKLPVGANGQVLTADSTETSGLKYTTPTVGTVTNVTSGTAALTVATSTTTPALTVRSATTSVNGIVQLSDSTGTTSSTLAATPTAVKAAYDLANAALPKAGGVITGALEIGNTGSLVFEGSTNDGNETTITVADPTADRTITFPNVTGNVVTTGDTGTVTSTMIANSTIVDADISASAAIAGTKISPDFGSQNTVTTGTATASGFIPTGSGVPTNGMYLPAANQLAFSTNGVRGLFLGEDGRISVGRLGTEDAAIELGAGATGNRSSYVDLIGDTTYTDYGLRLIRYNAGANANSQLTHRGTGELKVTTQESAPITFDTGNVERARIDSSGRVLVGTSTNIANGAFQVGAATGTSATTAQVIGSNAASAWTMLRSNAGAIVESGDLIGAISYDGFDGSSYVPAARISAQVDGTPGTDDMPGALVFSTTADGAATTTERMRIDSAGNVGIGTTSPSTALQVNGTVTATTFSGAFNATNISSGTLAEARLPFQPIQQGGGTSQNTNKIYIGWSEGNVLRLQVDVTDFGATWPIGVSGNAATVTTNANLTGHITSVGNATVLGSFTSAQLATALTDETGTGANVFATSPTLVTPAIGAATGTSLSLTGDITIGDKIIHNGDTNTSIRFPEADTIALETDGSERARVDSSGRLLVGNTIARTNIAGGTPGVQIEGVNDNSRRVTIISSTSENQGGLLAFAAQRSGTIGGNTIVGNNANLGAVQFNGSDGANFIPAASIQGETDGTPGTDDMPGRLVFSTRADGAASPAERMRIDKAGTLQVFGLTRLNTTDTAATSTTSAIARTTAANNSGNVSFESVANNTEARHHISFVNPNGIVGSISTNASATAYNTSSDYRLKENIVPLTGAIDRLQQIPVHRFNFIADPDTVVDGFIAHEAAAVVPECVTGEKDQVDENGKPIYQGIDQSKIVPLLTAALQEALQKIEDLEARLTAANL